MAFVKGKHLGGCHTGTGTTENVRFSRGTFHRLTDVLVPEVVASRSLPGVDDGQRALVAYDMLIRPHTGVGDLLL